MEEERRAVSGNDLVDLPDEDGMIAGGVSRDEFAVKLDQGGFKKRSAALGSTEFDAEAFEFGRRLLRLGEEASPRFVIVGEEINAEEFLFLHEGMSFGAGVDADENLRGFEGDGGEGIGSHAVDAGPEGVAGFAHHGNDGDSGGELAEGFTEFSGGDGHVRWNDATRRNQNQI